MDPETVSRLAEPQCRLNLEHCMASKATRVQDARCVERAKRRRACVEHHAQEPIFMHLQLMQNLSKLCCLSQMGARVGGREGALRVVVLMIVSWSM